jgi:Tfp pilus assembly protein PilO
MSLDDVEISLKQFINSVWFKGLARIAVLILLPTAMWSLGYIYAQAKRIDVITAAEAVEKVITEDRLKAVEAAVISVANSVATQGVDIRKLESHLGEIDGKLSILIKQIPTLMSSGDSSIRGSANAAAVRLP